MGFPINFLQHSQMQKNPLNWESMGNWYPYVTLGWLLFSNILPSYGTLHHMGNGFSHQFHIGNSAEPTLTVRETCDIDSFQSKATFLPSYFHPIVFCIRSKIHMGRSWDICNHTSPKLWELLFHQIPIIWMVYWFYN